MFENIKNMNESLRNIKELRKMMSDPANQSPEKLMEMIGLDISDFDEGFQEMMTPSSVFELEYVYKSVNKEPSYAYPTDSGFDLMSNETVHFKPFERKLVPTGLYLNIPDGFEIQIRPKSGLALNKGITVLNTPGTVDQGYTGEIKVIAINMSEMTQTIDMGDKIAQAILSPVVQGRNVNLKRVLNINEKDRNENGFGSTGK